ncbi:MAG: TIGR03617 family F420-dependent LLM class oxidoreductase [Armatimonadetes bacterium]|nr:TIGR03617 family F420-dependent LLM class oxidoreductase [Armatimonadota bacterium]
MKIDIAYTGTLADVAQAARRAESEGFSGLWVPETQHDPFFFMLRAADATTRLEVGTAIAVSLARSPMTLAQTAWDLAALSKGRFLLGLGSQIRAHITRRFSMPWDRPVQQMREQIQALRAIWDAFQNGTPLDFRGRYYRMDLLTPFFSPGPIEHPHIPIGLAAVGPKMTELAAELADFIVLHPFTNLEYLERETLPAIERGLRKAGRQRQDVTVLGSLFAITGDEKSQARLDRLIRRQISFYGSTPAYYPVLEALGLGDLARTLHGMSRQGDWEGMAGRITDEVMEPFCIRASRQELPRRIQERFARIYDRVMLTVPLLDRLPEGARAGAS